MSYFDRIGRSTGIGLSRFTGSILPSVANILVRKQNLAAKNFVIGKAERPLLTQRMIRAPHSYVPAGTRKNLEKFTKDVLHDRKSFDKKAVAFAKGYANQNKEIKKESEQREYLEGEIEALVATHDRSVKTPYDFEHRANAVALKALRGEQKAHAEPPKPSQSQRLAAAGIQSPSTAAPRPYDRPWRTQQPTIGAPTTAPHAKELHSLGSMSNGALQFGRVTLPHSATTPPVHSGFGLESMTPPSAPAVEPTTPTPAQITPESTATHLDQAA
jgi:hypothetical protein